MLCYQIFFLLNCGFVFVNGLLNIKNKLFSKAYYTSNANVDFDLCPNKKLIKKSGGFQTSELQCATLCMMDQWCKYFTLNGDDCEYITHTVSPSAVLSTEGTGFFYVSIEETEEWPDLVKNLTLEGDREEPTFPLVTSLNGGISCPHGTTSCWSSTLNDGYGYLKVDLGQEYTIRKIISTANGQFPDYIANTTIHVGNQGSNSDPVFGDFGPDLPYGGQRLTRGGWMRGRYVFFQRKEPGNSMVLCLLEVYGHP